MPWKATHLQTGQTAPKTPANAVSVVVGLGLAAAGLGALGGFRGLDIAKAKEAEVWAEKQKRALAVPGGAVAPTPPRLACVRACVCVCLRAC